MLTTEEATDAITAAMPPAGVQLTPLAKVLGQTLRQEVCAERDQPPFDRVTMDGISIDFAAFAAGQRQFVIQSRQHAGDSRQSLNNPRNCIEIMTGAAAPAGTDCVIPVERISVAGDIATLEVDYAPQQRQFIHPQGSDHAKGKLLLSPGQKISPMDVAVIASCGLAELQVSRAPRIQVISTGNELVAAGSPIADQQIRMSNGPAVVALLQAHGYADCQHDHISDDKALLRARLQDHLQTSNVMILSGGVSMGKADFVPEVLHELGVETVFHKISQRPGKPMWFGIGPDGQAVFALPGNPVSTLVCCRQYVLPALAHASGLAAQTPDYALLTEAFSFASDLTCFLPVRLAPAADGLLFATPVPTNTSGDFAALSGTDGYLQLDRNTSDFVAGSRWPLHRWNRL